MRLFLQEHRLLIIVQFIQFTLFGCVIGLGGFRNWTLILYAIFLGLFFLALYLVYKYVNQRTMYKRLKTEFIAMEESQRYLGDSPLSKAMSALLKSQYHLYEREIIELKAKQEQHLTFMDRWIHQMKTPVSVLELLADDLDEPDASNIREEVERIKTGLNTVLHMSRLRTIERDFHVKQVIVKELITEVNKELKRYYIRNKVYPRVELEHENMSVETDEKWMHYILTQFIHNAVKYSAQKSTEIILRVYEQHDKTILEIEDYGIGIPASDIKRIYDPFFTGEAGRKYRESTGVGLYLVREVANYLGHEIEVESTVDEGTVFRIIF